MAALPGSMREQAESIRARLHIDPSGWRPSSEDISALPVVQDAVTRDVKLSFMYTKADGESAPRTVDPLGVVCKQTVWYLVARAPAGMRSYRISRMSKVVALAVTFKRPANFDLAAHWNASTAELNRQRTAFGATLAMSEEAVRSLRGWCPLAAADDRWPEMKISNGWRIFDVQFESASMAQFVALGLGPRARVLAPEALRVSVQKDLAAAVESMRVAAS
jgi:predicted DNA-binding transcriptional regulator YafY